MEQKYNSHIILQNPYEETNLINNEDNNQSQNTLIKPCLDTPKERKGLFILTKNSQIPDKKEKPKFMPKKQIDLSPFQFNFPLTLSQNQEVQVKESNQKETKENSDFEIDVMTESWGLNKLEKMEKELDCDTDNDKLKIVLENKQKENEKEEEIEEINIANDDNDDEISISKNSIIDITELRGSEIDKDEQSNREKDSKDSSLSDTSKKNNKRKYLRGHCPFNFFEKEKCKNMDFQKVNVRSYISEISAQWKVMTDEEKAPYVKLSEDFKKKVMETNNLDDLEEMRLSNKKRRRKKRNINPINKDNKDNNNKEEPQIINNNINFNNNKIENFSVYTSSRYVKKKKNNISNETNSNEIKSVENESSSYYQQTLEKSENDKKENKNNIFNEICDRFQSLKNISDKKTNEFIKSALIPFIMKSFEFLDSLKTENNDE